MKFSSLSEHCKNCPRLRTLTLKTPWRTTWETFFSLFLRERDLGMLQDCNFHFHGHYFRFLLLSFRKFHRLLPSQSTLSYS